ncbi:thioesterase, partial [Salmonella enterica subsp. enterica serovar Worthington str. BCH-3008]
MQTQIKVRGYHLDVYQHVNNARYLEFLEEARWDGLENSDSFQWMTARNIAFVVVNININYRRPAVLSDLLTVTSQVQQLNGKSGVLSQTITLEPEGQVVADALITFVCIDLKTQKALPLHAPYPAWRYAPWSISPGRTSSTPSDSEALLHHLFQLFTQFAFQRQRFLRF